VAVVENDVAVIKGGHALTDGQGDGAAENEEQGAASRVQSIHLSSPRPGLWASNRRSRSIQPLRASPFGRKRAAVSDIDAMRKNTSFKG
jgi:hypothetical protein